MKLYPIHVNIAVHITDGKGMTGSASFGCAMNCLPTEDDMPEILEKVMGMVPDDFRLMTRHESMIYYLREQKGYTGHNNIAMPAIKDGDEWHDPETANVYMPSDEDQFEDEEL